VTLCGGQNGTVRSFIDWHTPEAAVAGMRERLPAQTIDRVTEAIDFAVAKHGDQQRPTRPSRRSSSARASRTPMS
jgi:hypothetical protein